MVSGLASLALLLPNLSVAIRRLHDTDHSGWWVLIGLIPIVGFIVLLIFYLRQSDPGENQYGPPPAERSPGTHRLSSLRTSGPAARSVLDQGIIARDQCISRHSYGRNLPLRTISTLSPLSSGRRRTVKPKLIALMIPSPNSSWISSFSAGP